MTNLTEAYIKGELEEGWYWVKDDEGEIIGKYLKNYNGESYNGFIDVQDSGDLFVYAPCEVLAKVPTYEEYQALIAENDRLKKDNSALVQVGILDHIKMDEIETELAKYKEELAEVYTPYLDMPELRRRKRIKERK